MFFLHYGSPPRIVHDVALYEYENLEEVSCVSAKAILLRSSNLMDESAGYHTQSVTLHNIHSLYTAQHGFVVILRFPNLPVYIDPI